MNSTIKNWLIGSVALPAGLAVFIYAGKSFLKENAETQNKSNSVVIISYLQVQFDKQKRYTDSLNALNRTEISDLKKEIKDRNDIERSTNKTIFTELGKLQTSQQARENLFQIMELLKITTDLKKNSDCDLTYMIQ